jgi:hypothetical protein
VCQIRGLTIYWGRKPKWILQIIPVENQILIFVQLTLNVDDITLFTTITD